MARKIVFALGITALSLTASACNTVKGVGRDIESVGEAGDKVVAAPVRDAGTPA